MTVTSTRARIKLRRILQDTDNGVPKAMQDSANILHKEIMARVPRDTGNLGDQITAKMLRKGLRAEVGLRGKKAKQKAFYARFIEFGTKARKTKGRSNLTSGSEWYGKSPDLGAIPARPFITPAWDQKKPEIVSRITKAINEAVKAAQKL